ncbi:MAG: hypothetical protein OEV93_03575 [Candidatus Moranbacteria bacterium]|nr:hypothetical protein [Candidatus Moranbacteria bacterium]
MKTKFDIFVGQKKIAEKPEDQSLYDLKRAQAAASSVLFSKGRVQSKFFTNESGLYDIPNRQKFTKDGRVMTKKTKTWDGLSSRIVDEYTHHKTIRAGSFLYRQYRKAKRKCGEMNEEVKDGTKAFVSRISFVHIWNTSIVMSVLAGMFFMSMVYKYLGQSASALESIDQTQIAYERTMENYKNQKDKKNEEAEEVWNPEKEEEYMKSIMSVMEKKKEESFEKEVWDMVEGYPIEKMIPYILEKDRTVAAFLIGIAKKESNWGKRKPVLNGKDCYNYWGYRGIRDKMGSGGHTCFDSPKDAVDTVAKRLSTLVDEDLDTPSEMIIWKCGSSCKGHSDYSVKKWISDVDMYFKQLNEKD